MPLMQTTRTNEEYLDEIKGNAWLLMARQTLGDQDTRWNWTSKYNCWAIEVHEKDITSNFTKSSPILYSYVIRISSNIIRFIYSTFFTQASICCYPHRWRRSLRWRSGLQGRPRHHRESLTKSVYLAGDTAAKNAGINRQVSKENRERGGRGAKVPSLA